MDIHGTPSGPERARRAFEQRQRALIDASRSLVRAARERLAADTRDPGVREGRDELALSPAALAAGAEASAERAEHVRVLAEAHRAERLHTPERLERAAQRLLGG